MSDIAQISDPSRTKDPQRHSPAPPLAPLEFLQSQRRGSITDPSLHAASTNSTSRQFSESASVSSVLTNHDLNQISNMADSRPTSNYVFGDASAAHSNEPNTQLRKLLHTPPLEISDVHSAPRPDISDTQQQQQQQRPPQGHGSASSSDTTSDNSRIEQHTNDRWSNQQFNYNMRRHSIATSQEIHTQAISNPPHGTKRKLSADRNGFAPTGGPIDPQLVGPGVPSNAQIDPDAPPPKRRGSAIESRSLARLNVKEPASPWWPNGRRETHPMFPGIGNYTPADGRLPGEMASFAWPANPQPPDVPPVDHNTGMSRPFDPNMPLTMMPPGFPPDRRMSGPAALPSSSSSVQTRVLRSRSRTPSQQKQNGVAVASSPGASASQEEMTPPSSSSKVLKDSSTTPYSRSPELRISHKLAERKRRKEMKDLFDELRDQLPADRGMKSSKWEILSKAIDFVTHLKAGQQEMLREIEMLRHELEAVRQGIAPFPGAPPPPPPPHAVVYAQGVSGQFSTPPASVLQSQQQSHAPPSRPTSSQNTFSASGGSSGPIQNGAPDRGETHKP